MKPIALLALLCALALPALAASPAAPAPAPAPVSVTPSINAFAGVFAGGVAGVAALAVPGNSAVFRADGGGLYLHNNGWGSLTPAQKTSVLRIFHGKPIMIELGFGGGWGAALKGNYLSRGIRPMFIAANAFANNNHPTAAGWTAYMKQLRDAGCPSSTVIMPTFEYQNFAPNVPTLSENTVSKVPVFQDIITAAGGIVLDTPSNYFFGREQAYRDWVVDAIQWTRTHGGQAVVIVSPHTAADTWNTWAAQFLTYLYAHNAAPSYFAVENYTTTTDPAYPNVVGSDANPNNTLGVALSYIHALYPHTMPRSAAN